jgi:5-carboxymethyl-2-hydroxymuconate isomerase
MRSFPSCRCRPDGKEDLSVPHLTLDYSANLRADGAIDALCATLARALVDVTVDGKPVYPVGGIRVRAFAAEDYCIADGRADAAYLHACLSVARGRSEATLKATGDAVFAVIQQHFAALFERRGLALSLEIQEFPESGTWKHNNLHARLRVS